MDRPQQHAEPQKYRAVPGVRLIGGLGRDSVTRFANAEIGVADTDRSIAVELQPAEFVATVIEIETVRAADVLGHPAPGLAAPDTEMLRRHIGIVEHEVVVVGARDADIRAEPTV